MISARRKSKLLRLQRHNNFCYESNLIFKSFTRAPVVEIGARRMLHGPFYSNAAITLYCFFLVDYDIIITYQKKGTNFVQGEKMSSR